MKTLVFTVTIKDCEQQFFRAGGKGGQNQNKRETGVRIIHHASGARGEARDERSQEQNRKLAFKRMAESKEFQYWAKQQAMVARYEETPMEKIKSYNFNRGEVLDHRTGVKAPLEKVLDGEIDIVRNVSGWSREQS
jgi:protein subunit release factor A